jgi:hypothetical protein
MKSWGIGVIRREAVMESLTVLAKFIMSGSRAISLLPTLSSSVASPHILRPLRGTSPEPRA